MAGKQTSGFEDAPGVHDMCINPSHQPPNHLYIPPGKIYRHICPSCGKETVIHSSQIQCGKDGLH